MTIDEARARYAKSLAICLNQEQINTTFIKQFKAILEPYSGNTLPVHIYYFSPQGRALVKMGVQWSVNPTDELLGELVEFLGESAVELEFE